MTVSTIHKAKGQEYDMVVYLPKEPGSSKTKFIDTVKTAILLSAGIDIRGEMEGEQSRLHFVAFTRAREKLAVITDARDVDGFDIKGACRVVIDESAEEEEEGWGRSAAASEGGPAKYKEAYSMFVAGRVAESRKMLERGDGDGWIEKKIEGYFEGLERLSPTGMPQKASDLLKDIFGTPRAEHPSAAFGTRLHKAMYDILDGDHGMENLGLAHEAGYDDGRMKGAVRNALDGITELKSRYHNLRVHSLEKKIEVPAGSMTDHGGADGITFSGKIDAVFRHDSGYVIVDYKTSKSAKKVSDHRKQMAAYKRMLSRAEGVPEEEIDTKVLFVSIIGSINTGSNDYGIFEAGRNAYARFEKDLDRMLEWKLDVGGFIGELLEEREDVGSPYDEIIEELARGRRPGQGTGYRVP